MHTGIIRHKALSAAYAEAPEAAGIRFHPSRGDVLVTGAPHWQIMVYMVCIFSGILQLIN
jgi:hypothetical protein